MSIPQENAKTNREARGKEKRRSSFENEVTRELREIGKVTGRDMSRAIAEVQSSPDDYSESTGMTAPEAASLALEVTGLAVTGAEVVMSKQSPAEVSEAASLLEPFKLPVAIYGEGVIGMKREHYEKLRQHVENAYDQALNGVFVEHDCPAMFACAAIIADIDPEGRRARGETESRNVSCPKCRKRVRRAGLDMHMRAVHQPNEKERRP